MQKQLEAEKKALAEERAKAEARQAEAMNKLNELQSKLIQVTKDARGIILSMSDILFDVNKATLKADLKTSLAKVAGILSVYQQFNVSIEGNTDNTGSEEHNMKLSQQRADFRIGISPRLLTRVSVNLMTYAPRSRMRGASWKVPTIFPANTSKRLWKMPPRILRRRFSSPGASI